MERCVRIAGLGAYLPAKVVESHEVDAAMGLAAGASEASSGVRRRRYADPASESQSAMAASAVRAALASAGRTVADIDCLVNTSGTGEQEIPSNAALTLKALGVADRPLTAFDINATCMGFLVGLDTLSYPLAMGRYKRLVLVSSEIASVGLDPTCRETRPLFGDGACAAVVEGGGGPGGSRILASAFELHVAGVDHCRLVGGRSRLPPRQFAGNESEFFFRMDGRAAMRLGANVVPAFVQRMLAGAGLRLADMDLIVPHQASRVAMEIFKRRMEVADEQWMDCLAEHGNMISASLPLALLRAVEQGRVVRGSRVMLLASAAGFGVGAMVLEY